MKKKGEGLFNTDMRATSVTLVCFFIVAKSQNLTKHHYNDDTIIDTSAQTIGLKHCSTSNPTNFDSTAFDTMKKKMDRLRIDRANITVPTYYHVITDGSAGNITKFEIHQSIEVLNAAFVGKFVFQLKESTFTDNRNWFRDESYEFEMKQKLRRGVCGSLNIYSNSGYGYLGHAKFPFECSYLTVMDGVMINSRTIPGGNILACVLFLVGTQTCTVSLFFYG